MQKNKTDQNRELDSLPSTKYKRMQLADLLQAISSPSGELVKWVLVEGRVDLELYARLFNSEVKVYMAGMRNDDASTISGGSKAVRNVVGNVLRDGQTDRIIGIIDRDYSDFRQIKYVKKRNIFRTDYRDVEMTLMMMPSAWAVVTSLPAYTNVDNVKWVEAVSFLGVLRATWAFEDIKGKYEIGVSDLYDEHSHRIRDDWKSRVLHIATICSGGKITINDINNIEKSFHLNSMPFAVYSRGHDAFPLLIAMMVSSQMGADELALKMARRCSVEECRQLKLFKDIERWQQQLGYDYLK